MSPGGFPLCEVNTARFLRMRPAPRSWLVPPHPLYFQEDLQLFQLPPVTARTFHCSVHPATVKPRLTIYVNSQLILCRISIIRIRHGSTYTTKGQEPRSVAPDADFWNHNQGFSKCMLVSEHQVWMYTSLLWWIEFNGKTFYFIPSQSYSVAEHFTVQS